MHVGEESLFENERLKEVKTEGIKYVGSKKEIIPYILQIIDKLDVQTILDGFAGTTRVSQALSKAGYHVFANDCAVWSKVFSQCYLLNKKSRSYYQPLIEYLNNVPGKEGWYTEHYGGTSNQGRSKQLDGKKKPWQIHNTKKLDGIRATIPKITEDDIERSVLITSLILALDKVDNTVGHYASYLREWSKRSYKVMKLKVPKISPTDIEHKVFNENIFELIPEIEVDLAYYDPPYGSSNEKMPPSRVRYASYYHVWKTICLNDRPPVFGAANRREDSRDVIASSVFESYRKNDEGIFEVIVAIEELIRKTNAKYIILSYSDKGRATLEQIINLLHEMDLPHKTIEINHKANVMKSMRWTNEWIDESDDRLNQTTEYLFVINKHGIKLPSKLDRI